MRVLSLGWGLQSFGLAAMSALGELPPVDVAIHADTTHERTATYEFAARWTPWLEEHGVKVVTVRSAHAEPIRTWKKGPEVTIPAFIRGETPTGIITRQCTGSWKIAPMKRWLQANRNRQPVEQWIGITADEIGRVKPSNVKYITHRWPFVERNWRRSDVAAWLADNHIQIPPRSACVFCPFQSRKEWRSLQTGSTEDFAEAVAVDEAIREKRPPFALYLHPSRIPLRQVDFRSEQERGQMELWDAECSGVCGI